MKKFYSFLVFLLAGLFTQALADKGTMVFSSPDDHQVFNVSPNGKWACGIDDSTGQNRAFMWNLETGEITYYGLSGYISKGWAISDDGIMCGTSTTSEVSDNGALTESGGYWENGKFNVLKDENGMPIESVARAITPDGQYIAGTAIINGKYIPCIWKNGILERRLNTNGEDAGVSGISDDGSIVYGWTTVKNRVPCFWNPDLTVISNSRAPWCEVYSISPNKKYLFARDGNGRFVYDMTEPNENKRYRSIPLLTSDAWDDGGTMITDDGTVIIYESPGTIIQGTGYIYYPDKTNKKIADWIKEEYDAEIPEEVAYGPGYSFFSRDMKTLVSLCAGENGNYFQVAWKFDQEVDYAKPASTTARSMPATSYVLVKWMAPLTKKENVTGYKVYRNDKLLEEVAGSELSYIDRSPGSLNLTYAVSAMYGTQESEKASHSIKLGDNRYTPKPNALRGYQSNYNNVVLNWISPNTGYDANVRLHNNEYATSFSSNTEKTFYAGVNFNKDIINCYYDKFNLTAVEFYACAPVSEMVLFVYVNGEEKINQPIDQSKLIWGANNAIKLNQTLTLAENSEVKAVIKIVQSEAGSNIGLTEGPAVEGGDLFSENGTSWLSLTDLSDGVLSNNWMISLLLESNGKDDGVLAPSLRSENSLHVQSYTLYRNDEELIEAEAGQTSYVDKDLEPGVYKYKIVATYGSLQSEPVTFMQTVRPKALSQCPAPENIRGGADADHKLTLKWDIPEQTEVGYTNWKPQQGIGYSAITEWYYGVDFDAEYMLPYADAAITKINFWPLANADFTIHVYENDEKIRSQKVKDYNLKKMNTVDLNEVVPIQKNKTYRIALQVSGVTADAKPLGVDTNYPFNGGRMMSEDGLFFKDAGTGIGGNLMLSMEVQKINYGFNPGLTYKVTVDGNTQPDEYTDTHCTIDYDMSSMQPVNVSVAAIYPAGERISQTTVIDPTSIHSDKVSVVKVYPNPATSFIHIEGNVSEVSMTTITGKEVYRNREVQTIDVSSFEPGMYLLKSMIDGKLYINKVQVIR